MKSQRLVDEYEFPGFRAFSKVHIHPLLADARIVILKRRQKKLFAAVVGLSIIHFMIGNGLLSVIFPVEMPEYFLGLKSAVSGAGNPGK